jgi:hypothetical protein
MNIDVSHMLESSLALAVGGAVLKAMDRMCRKRCSDEIQEIPAPLPPPRQSHEEEEDEDEMGHTLSCNSEAAFRLPHYDNSQSPGEK